MAGDKMHVTEAKNVAKAYLAEMFGDETIDDMRVEEVVFDEERNTWKITLSFSCHWGVLDVLAPRAKKEYELRSYKCIHVDDRDGRPGSMFDRLLPPWAGDEEAGRLAAHT